MTLAHGVNQLASLDDHELPTTFDPNPQPNPRHVPCVFRPGDHALLLNPRRVARVGYRLTPAECLDEVDELLRTSEGFEACKQLVKAFGISPGGQRFSGKLRDALAYGRAQMHSFGGPERGVVFFKFNGDYPVGRHCLVDSKRQHRIGRYYPPSGRSSYYDDDYESGGLADARTIVVVGTSIGTYLATDLLKIPPGTPYEDFARLAGALEPEPEPDGS